MSKINWLQAKRDYIADQKLSLPDIARKYGLADTTVKERAAAEHWAEKRRRALLKADEILTEKAGETIAEFQARKFRQGMFVANRGLQGISRHAPRSARESKELFEVGMKTQTEAMGLDNPKTQINVQNNNFMSLEDFFAELEKRTKARGLITDEQPATGTD